MMLHTLLLRRRHAIDAAAATPADAAATRHIAATLIRHAYATIISLISPRRAAAAAAACRYY